MKADIIVVGAGPAGMMAGLSAASAGASVCLVERNDRPGRKLGITGKGRCNITNDCPRDEFMGNVPRNPKFLYSALSSFSPEDTKAFFEANGVPLKTERGRRVFPVSDRAADIVDAMVRVCRETGVRFMTGRVRDAKKDEDGLFTVRLSDGTALRSRRLILCTGGLSYPRTGSTGDGYRLAGLFGHGVTEISPSLVPLCESGHDCARMQGLSLKNVRVTLTDTRTGKSVFTDFGEMLFTHFGVSGPLILSASAHLADMKKDAYVCSVDLKPALDPETLDARLVSDFRRYANRDFIHALDDLLPAKMIPVVVERSGIPERMKTNGITKEMRRTLVRILKGFEIRISGFRPIEEAVVTRGGVDVRDIDPRSMESRLCPGLYLAGELLDVDAYTGGFNLQIALSTGRLAGLQAARDPGTGK